MTSSSYMHVATMPARWGFEAVGISFGVIWVRSDQTMAMRGDIIRHIVTQQLYEFHGRQGDILHAAPVSPDYGANVKAFQLLKEG